MVFHFLQKCSRSFFIFKWINKSVTYIFLILRAILSNGITIMSGSLTFSTLLGIVPTLLVFFSVLSLLPAFGKIKENLEHLIFNVISPAASSELNNVFNTVIVKTSNLGVPSIFVLFMLSFLLIYKIDNTINKNIWHLYKRRKLSNMFTTYWAVISFGPMLLGILLFAKSYLNTLLFDNPSVFTHSLSFLLSYLQVFILFGVLYFTYVVFPQTRVKHKYGFISAAIATFALVVSKNLFVLYVTTFPTYHVIYGTIAIFPITVFWLYIVWLIILTGANLTCVLNTTSFKILYFRMLKDHRKARIQIEREFELMIDREQLRLAKKLNASKKSNSNN